MWVQFSLAVIFAALLLYIPGFLFFRAFGFNHTSSFAFAPAYSVTSFSLLALCLYFLDIHASLFSIVIPTTVLPVILRVLLKNQRLSRREDLGHDQYTLLAAYLLFGVASATLVFVRNLDGAASFFQAYDNWLHLGVVRSFLESGNFSSFQSIYMGYQDVNPYTSQMSFYPSAWHLLVALIVQTLGVPITMAVNAINFSLVALVFSSGCFILFKSLFKSDNNILLSGVISSVIFSICPWDFLIFGPLYPNLLSIVLIPGSISMFLRFLSVTNDGKLKIRMQFGFLFVLMCIGIAFSQPNGIFTLGVFLAPYLVFCAGIDTYKPYVLKSRFVRRAAAVSIIAAIWVGLFLSPPLQSVVQHNWASSTSLRQSIVDVLLFSVASHPMQLLASLFTLVGLLVCTFNQKYRWMVFPYVFTGISYVVCVSTEGVLKHLLTGFWYTDPHRIALQLSLFALPIAVLGISKVLTHTVCAITGRFVFANKRLALLQGGLLFIVACFLLYPSYELRGFGGVETPFGYVEAKVQYQNSKDGDVILTSEEIEFAEQVKQLIPDHSLLINSPNDGSGYLHSLLDLNVLYRQFKSPSLLGEKADSSIIRQGLNNYLADCDVQSAIDDLDCKYVLLLDVNNLEDVNRRYFWTYAPEDWSGIESIDDDTPGFTCLLSKNDMRLYRIDR